MKRLRMWILTSGLFALIAWAPSLEAAQAARADRGFAQPVPAEWADAIATSRVAAEAHRMRLGVPGLSLAVAYQGEIIWEDGFGFSDVENRVPVWPETLFRIASISKALTSGALGRLYEEGRLDLDAPIQRYLPEFPEKGQPITSRMLAGHLAGVRHYEGDEFANRTHYTDVVAALEIFQDDPLVSAPGEEYHYSTYGWNLLSAVIQEVSGQPFLEYMREVVIEPAGLAHTTPEYADSILPHRAHFYLRGEDGRLVNAPWVDNSNKWAGGGYLSTAGDMVRYASALLSGEVVSRETVALLFTPQTTRSGESTGYGIGWGISGDAGEPQICHTGGAMGGSTILCMLPEDGFAVAVLTNLGGAGHRQLADHVLQAFVADLPR